MADKKSKTGLIAIIAGATIIAAFGAYKIFGPSKKKNSKSAPSGNKSAPPAPAGSAMPGAGSQGGGDTHGNDGRFPLKFGSSGDLVQKLQYALQGYGQTLPNYGADGQFGSETEAALGAITGKRQVDSMADLNNIINGQYAGQVSRDFPTQPPVDQHEALKLFGAE